MPTTASTRNNKLLTADDLLRLHGEGVRGELIRGMLSETMPRGIESGRVAVNLGVEMAGFVKRHNLGTVIGFRVGVRLERNPDTVRALSIAFFSAGKLPLDDNSTDYPDVAPDLAVEVSSFNDTRHALNDKVLMWLRHGVRLVWVVHPDTRTVDVHREGVPVAALTASDALDGADVLPGFSCPVSEVFGG